MHTAMHPYTHNTQNLQGFLAFDNTTNVKRPAVLVAPDWSGRNTFADQRAKDLAAMGYVGFALDMYGDGRQGLNNEEKSALMAPLIADRKLLQARIQTAYKTIAALPQVDATRIAVIGFCFGGLCALDLARTNPHLKAAVTFHGLLKQPENDTLSKINAQLLVLHGYDDPSVPPDHVSTCAQEMTTKKANWEIHMYGHTQHAFTNPLAHDPANGLIYSEAISKRAFHAMEYFLNMTLG